MLRRIRHFGATLIGIVTLLITVGDKVEVLAKSKVWLYGYAAFGIAKVEIVALLALLLFWPQIVATLRDIAGLIQTLKKGPGRETPRIIILAVVGLVCVGVAGYHGAKYVKGKGLYIRYYQQQLLIKADKAFSKGDTNVARLYLRVCSDALGSTKSQEYEHLLDTRLKGGAELRRVLDKINENTPGSVRLLEAIYTLERDNYYYNTKRKRFLSKMHEMEGEYKQALTELKAEHFVLAAQRLRVINQQWPGFGDANVILDEITPMVSMRSQPTLDSKWTPYLVALQRSAVDEFAEEVIRVQIPRDIGEN